MLLLLASLSACADAVEEAPDACLACDASLDSAKGPPPQADAAAAEPDASRMVPTGSDAAPPDAAQDTPPATPPVIARFTVIETFASCELARLRVVWTAESVEACTLTATPETQAPSSGEHRAESGRSEVELEVGLAADTRFELDCRGPGGRVTEAREVRRAMPELPEQATHLDRRTLAGVVERCGAMPSLLDQDIMIHADEASAAQLCRCLGYQERIDFGTDRPCFSSPHDNFLAWWAEGAWQIRRAPESNACVESVECAEPYRFCEELP